MCVQNLKFVALSVPEIIGGTQKIWAVPNSPTIPIYQILKGFLFGWTLRIYLPSLKFVALAVIAILGWVVNPNLGEGKAVRGRGWHRSKERW